MKDILVTGGKGQVASSLKDIAHSLDGYRLVFADVDELDITIYKEVKQFFESHEFAYCINCAAYTAVDLAETQVELSYEINAEGVLNLAKACSLKDCILIHISTDFVFDGSKESSYSETDTANPINVYGASKLKGEIYLQENLERYFIIRTSWVYSEHGKNFVKTMLGLSKTKKELKIVADQFGSPTYARDLAAFLLRLVEGKCEAYGLYHFSNQGNISWYDFTVEIFGYLQKSIRLIPIDSEAFQATAVRPKRSTLNLSKTKAAFPFKIPYWKDSLHLCLERLKSDKYDGI